MTTIPMPDAIAEELAREQKELEDDIRDEFAMRALTGLAATVTEWDPPVTIAIRAYDLANAFMAERRKRRG